MVTFNAKINTIDTIQTHLQSIYEFTEQFTIAFSKCIVSLVTMNGHQHRCLHNEGCLKTRHNYTYTYSIFDFPQFRFLKKKCFLTPNKINHVNQFK